MTEKYILELEKSELDWLNLIVATSKQEESGILLSKILQATPLDKYIEAYCNDCERISPEEAYERSHNEGYD